MNCSAPSRYSTWHCHVLNGMASLLLPYLDLMRAFLSHRGKTHAAAAYVPVTRRHAGISACLAACFRTFVSPQEPERRASDENSRQVSAFGHDGRLVSSGAANGTQHHWMTGQCRAASSCGAHDAWLLMTSVPTGPNAVILRLPLLRSHHRRAANPTTRAAHASRAPHLIPAATAARRLGFLVCARPSARTGQGGPWRA